MLNILTTRFKLKKEIALHEFERGQVLLKGVIESNVQNNVIGDLPGGAYELVATTTNGDSSQFAHRFELFNENSKLLPIPSAFEFKSLKMRAEPGEEASFLIGTSLENLLLLYEVHVDGKRISQKWITLSNEQRKMTLPIKESYRGGVQLSFIGVHNNREITETRTISVPLHE